MTDWEWISTGEACRILGWSMSTWTFRDNYRDLLPWTKTPGGHFRWWRAAVEAQANPVPVTKPSTAA